MAKCENQYRFYLSPTRVKPVSLVLVFLFFRFLTLWYNTCVDQTNTYVLCVATVLWDPTIKKKTGNYEKSVLTNHIECQSCFPVTIATRFMLTCKGTHGPIHISGQWTSREAQGRSLSTDRTVQIATLELGIVCIRVSSFHTTRDITSVALGQCYSVGGVHSLVGLGLTFDCYLWWEGWGP